MTQESSSYAYDSWQNAMTPPPANKDARCASEKTNEKRKKMKEQNKEQIQRAVLARKKKERERMLYSE